MSFIELLRANASWIELAGANRSLRDPGQALPSSRLARVLVWRLECNVMAPRKSQPLHLLVPCAR